MTITVLRPLSWENFHSSILVKGEERVHRVSEAPLIELFADGRCVGLWLEVSANSEIPKEVLRLAFVRSQMTTRTVKKKLVPVLELALSSPALYRQFYHFAIAT